jgi:hypothetical protein
LKRKRQEIAKGKQKINNQDLSVGKAINEKANDAAYTKIENRLRLNENGKTKPGLDYSGRKGALRFIKPPVATVV